MSKDTTPQVEYLSGKSLAFRHGFFTKKGGFTRGPAAGLNATTRCDSDEAAVKANRTLALQALKLDPERFVFLDELAHGSRVLAASEAAAGKDFDGYDVIMTNESSISIGVSTADCLPIVVASEEEGAVAIVHAGWRGLAEQVVAKAVVAMQQEYNINPATLKAVIGPAIAAEHYEFGSEAKKLFDERYVLEIDGKPHVDLLLQAQDQLTEAGVTQVEVIQVDTFVDERFYSVRREGDATGRFLTIASL